jgi:nuclear pore complex protein Nup98-Nup96
MLAQGETTTGDVFVTSLTPSQSDVGILYSMPLARLIALQTTAELPSLLANGQVSIDNGVPSISYKKVPFSTLKSQLSQQASPEDLEIYELLHVLYDDYDDEFTSGLPTRSKHKFDSQVRKDRLTKFLTEIISRRHGERIKSAAALSGATAAVMQLTAHNIHAACDALTAEKDSYLSLLVSQIDGADPSFQEDIAVQIAAWRDQNVLSEINEEIRALYDILSGNTSIVRGKQNVPAEDRASTFAISEKFELDWIQAFGLCLWYGKQKNADISAVVADFLEKLESRLESASPVQANGQEDILWVVLKLFASKTQSSGMEKPLLPEALSATSKQWDVQKTFCLFNAVESNVPGLLVDEEKSDNLAMAFAFEQSARGNLTAAIFALLHLSNAAQRTAYIKDLLTRYAPKIASPAAGHDTDNLWSALIKTLAIPEEWLFSALALYARSCNEQLEELHYLIEAQDFSGAHETLLHRVAPRLVVDEDWNLLAKVLSLFGDNPAAKVDVAVRRTNGTEWSHGGGVYADFLSLLTLTHPEQFRQRASQQDVNSVQQEKQSVLSRLQRELVTSNARFLAEDSAVATRGLPVNADRERLEERVALCEMGRVVAMVIDDVNGDKVSLSLISYSCMPWV